LIGARPAMFLIPYDGEESGYEAKTYSFKGRMGAKIEEGSSRHVSGGSASI
jgi:hypothetical protein